MANNGNKPVLALTDITKIYKTKRSFFARGVEKVVALNHVSMSLAQGEIFGLVGESGSGKTTCGRLIVKLEDPDLGLIFLNGDDPGTIIFEFPPPLPNISLEKSVNELFALISTNIDTTA